MYTRLYCKLRKEKKSWKSVFGITANEIYTLGAGGGGEGEGGAGGFKA